MSGHEVAGNWTATGGLPFPPLTQDEVQIWRASLPQAETSTEDYAHLLVPDEKVRAERLRAGRVRLQFVVARASLRVLLGSALGIGPTQVPITTSSFGKPETPGIFYNVAHSGDTVLIALCRSCSVGLDIEYLTRDVDALEIAKSSFAINECRALSEIDDAAVLRQAFFRCWTRKEAVIKADGRGLSLALDSFEVPVADAVKNAPVRLPAGGSARADRYYVSDIFVEISASAAYAVATPQLSLRTFSLDAGMTKQKAALSGDHRL